MFRLKPLADQLLLYRLPHVPEKRTRSVVVVVVVRAEVHVQIQSTIAMQRGRRERISPGARHLAQVVGSHVHFSRYSQAYLSVQGLDPR